MHPDGSAEGPACAVVLTTLMLLQQNEQIFQAVTVQSGAAVNLQLFHLAVMEQPAYLLHYFHEASEDAAGRAKSSAFTHLGL